MALRGLAKVLHFHICHCQMTSTYIHLFPKGQISLYQEIVFSLYYGQKGCCCNIFCQFSVISILINAGFVDGIDLKESDKSLVSNILRFGMDKLTFC